MKRVGQWIATFWRGIHAVEDAALVSLLLVMILLAVAQIVLRNVAGESLVWADPFLRVAVLWIGLLGSTIAARDNSHIAIDVVTRYLSESHARILGMFLALFAAVICAVLGWYALLFVLDEHEYGTTAFASVPAWVCEVIMPFAFAMLAVRYVIIAVGLALGRRPIRPGGV